MIKFLTDLKDFQDLLDKQYEELEDAESLVERNQALSEDIDNREYLIHNAEEWVQQATDAIAMTESALVEYIREAEL